MARRVLAVLLLAMAGGQLADVGGFVDIVATYGIGGTAVAAVVAATLIVGELVGGIGLLVTDPSRRRQGATVALVVALAWSLLSVQAFVRGLELENCGCFGVYLGQPLRWWVLVQDVEFVALAVWARASATGHRHRTGRPERAVITAD